jgi:ABC-type transport system involved in cytochrome c biogenesis ATPase subunit
MQAHLAGGGIIVAATHGPLGLDGAKELRLGGDLMMALRATTGLGATS